MKISIIVPVNNTELYLERCINSILSQTYRNFEIILVTDGCTDGSDRICEQFRKQDSRIVHISQEYKGVSAARNTALDNAGGDYICFIDSDDCVSPYYLEKLLNMLLETGADVAMCGYIINDRHSTPENVPVPLVLNRTEVIDKKNYYLRLYTDKEIGYVVIWNKIYKRKIFEHVRFARGKIHEDEGLVHHVIKQTDKIAVNYEPLYFYTIRPDSIMRKKGFNPGRMDIFPFLEERMEYFSNENMYDLVFLTMKKYLVKCLQLYNSIDESVLHGEMYKKQILEQYKQMLKKAFSNPVNSKKFLMKMTRYALSPASFKSSEGHELLYGKDQ